VRFSCRLASEVCRDVMLRSALSYMLAVERRLSALLMANSLAVPWRLAAHGLDQGVEDVLGDLNHLGRGLVGLLVLDQARRFLIEVDARDGGAVALKVGGEGRRQFCGKLCALG